MSLKLLHLQDMEMDMKSSNFNINTGSEPVYKIDPVRPQDVKATMTPRESFESRTANTDYAINALSHPDDNTYRKNLARYLDSKGFDLVTKDRQLYIGDRDSMNIKPVTKNFIGDMIGSSPEIAGSILGATAGSSFGPLGTFGGAVAGAVGGDAVQQLINSYMFGEELTPSQRGMELGKSAGLAAGGELAGSLIGRAITPIRGIDQEAKSANAELFKRNEVDPTPATLTGNDFLTKFEEVMGKGTLGGKKIADMKKNEIQGIEGAVNRLLEGKAGATGDTYGSGRNLVDNLTEQLNNAKGYYNQEYGKLAEDAGITEIPLKNLKNSAQEIIDRAKAIPAFKNGIDRFVSNIIDSPGSLTYPEYQELRSLIGSKIKDAGATGQSGSVEAYRKLYKAINDDFDKSFANSPLIHKKRSLDKKFKDEYETNFDDSFTKGIVGAGRNKIDPERIGDQIARSPEKANIAANTADAGYGLEKQPIKDLFDESYKYVRNQGRPDTSMAAAADSILNRSVAPDGGMSLPKMRTNLDEASGLDELFKINKARGTERPGLNPDPFKKNKDDIIKMIELSGQNQKIANKSGTAWMDEMLKMKNDPVSALFGLAADQTISRAYKNKVIQNWLTNGNLTDKEARMINNIMQVSSRPIGAELDR